MLQEEINRLPFPCSLLELLNLVKLCKKLLEKKKKSSFPGDRRTKSFRAITDDVMRGS